MDSEWMEYIDCMKRLEEQVKLVAWHTLETARYTEEAANQAKIVSSKVLEYINENRI